MDERTQTVHGRVVTGHGVASGQGGDPRYPEGTIALQIPVFVGLGVDIPARRLDRLHLGTINVDVSPRVAEWVAPPVTVRGVRWSAHAPPEDFSFAPCRIGPVGGELVEGVCYRPHPETKPEHDQPPGVVEVLAPWIEGLGSGAAVQLEVDPQHVRFTGSP